MDWPDSQTFREPKTHTVLAELPCSVCKVRMLYNDVKYPNYFIFPSLTLRLNNEAV